MDRGREPNHAGAEHRDACARPRGIDCCHDADRLSGTKLRRLRAQRRPPDVSSPATGPSVPAGPPRLGVVMLDTRFPRLPGDIGNPATFPGIAVDYRRVPHATVARAVVAEAPDAGLADAIVAAAADLHAAGADLIATSCGFLGILQARLEAAVLCPVIASALVRLPAIRRSVGADATIGILTFDARKLGAHHFGVEAGPVAVRGIEAGTCLHPAIAGDRTWFDPDAARADAVAAAESLKAAAPDMAAAVLECTNLVPYRDAIALTLGVPLFDITAMIDADLTVEQRGTSSRHGPELPESVAPGMAIR
ncbi:MAG: aspartate/glutamate racemase family protein [Alphaproteobacteria bacterium]